MLHDGVSERDAALVLVDRMAPGRRITLGADTPGHTACRGRCTYQEVGRATWLAKGRSARLRVRLQAAPTPGPICRKAFRGTSGPAAELPRLGLALPITVRPKSALRVQLRMRRCRDRAVRRDRWWQWSRKSGHRFPVSRRSTSDCGLPSLDTGCPGKTERSGVNGPVAWQAGRAT